MCWAKPVNALAQEHVIGALRHRALVRKDVSKTSQDHCKHGSVPKRALERPSNLVLRGAASFPEWSQRKQAIIVAAERCFLRTSQPLGPRQSRKIFENPVWNVSLRDARGLLVFFN